MCKELKLIIEVDGLTHQFNDIALKDAERQKDLEDAGFTVLRFNDWEIMNDLGGALNILHEWINAFEIEHPEVIEMRRRKREAR
jgi:very-short-patch-repair endonuclease